MELAIVIIVLLNLIVTACTFPYYIIYDPSYAFMRLTYAYACNRCVGGSDVSGVRGSEPRGGARDSDNRRSNRQGGVARVP